MYDALQAAVLQSNSLWLDQPLRVWLNCALGLPAQAFFMTAKALHLGIVHMIADQREVARKIHLQSQYLRDLQAMLEG